MRKLLTLVLTLFLFGNFTVKADKDYVITKDQLPEKALSFINTHFAFAKISYVKEERDFFSRNYEVDFADGAKVEFVRNGKWIDIDCRYTEVPASAIPNAISSYVRKHFPEEKILKIERERNGYEVKLTNKLELTFDKNFNIRNIDD